MQMPHTEYQSIMQHAAGLRAAGRHAKLHQHASCCRTNVNAAAPVKGVR